MLPTVLDAVCLSSPKCGSFDGIWARNGPEVPLVDTTAHSVERTPRCLNTVVKDSWNH